MTNKLSFDDVQGCEASLFEWAESYDTKDWERLRKCVAPTLQVDYRSFLNMKWDAMPAEEFVDMASNPKFLGNKLLKTQHFIGASKWEKISDTEIIGRHQVRVAHQKYADESFKDVVLKGHAHGGGTMLYKKVDGVWKFAGLCPDTRWFQHDYDKIFLDSKDHFTQE